jgi:hypothetical protein
MAGSGGGCPGKGPEMAPRPAAYLYPGNQWPCSGMEAACWEARAIWQELDCPNPNLQKMQWLTSAGNRA